MFEIIRSIFATVFISGSVFAVILGEPFVEKVAEYRQEHIAAIITEADTLNQQAEEIETGTNPDAIRQHIRQQLINEDTNWKVTVAVTGFAMPLLLFSSILLAAYQMANRANYRLRQTIAQRRAYLNDLKDRNDRMYGYTSDDAAHRADDNQWYERAEGSDYR